MIIVSIPEVLIEISIFKQLKETMKISLIRGVFFLLLGSCELKKLEKIRRVWYK